jgi:hypothetical protein
LRATVFDRSSAAGVGAGTAAALGCVTGVNPPDDPGVGTPKMVFVALAAEWRDATGAGTWLAATPGGRSGAAAGGGAALAAGGGAALAAGGGDAAGAAGLLGDVVRPVDWAAFAASAAARALRISAAGIPKIVFVALAWRAAWADGAGAGTLAGAAAATCGRFGATAGSFIGWTTRR